MSTRQDYNYNLSESERRRLEAERQRRELELARQRAEQARLEMQRNAEIAAQRRREQEQREKQRQAELVAQRRREQAQAIHQETIARSQAYQRETQRTLQAQQQTLQASQAKATNLSSQAATLQTSLTDTERALEASRTQVAQAQANLKTQIAAATALHQAAEHEEQQLKNSINQAQDTLLQVEKLAAIGIEDADAWKRIAAQGHDMDKNTTELNQQIQHLEQEINFVTQQAELQPAAMAVLMGMQKNGYELRDTLSKDGLIYYFEAADSKHQIAVRMNSATRAGEDSQRWEMLAETFEMVGETCLEELADFDTAMEEIGIGELQRGNFRLYPKDERSRQREKRGILPSPKPHRKSKTKNKNQSRQKMRA
jgi:chromosome segregation ATPase